MSVNNSLSSYTRYGAGTLSADERFADPFMDAASMAMPQSIQDALRWSEFIAYSNGVYRQALERVISYFITDVNITALNSDKDLGKEEKDKYEDFLDDTLGIKRVLHQVGLDLLVYGNSFTSLLMPFRRYLACTQCGLEMPFRKIHSEPVFGFKWTGYDFHATCPHCHYSGIWRHVDRRSGEKGDIKVKRWSPHDMELLWDPLTEDVKYIWKIPDDYRNLLREGKPHVLETASWEIIQAVKNNQNLQFDKDVIYHMKEDALAGIRNRGWGLSRIIANFRQAWYVQVLHRYNEAIALDYVIPFRVLTPAAKPGAGPESSDPTHSINLGNFVSRVQRMLRDRRRDPAKWNVLPFSLEYKALGGDAQQLAPRDLMDQGMDTLLTCVGVPIEFYKGTLSLQSAPAALRLFEANWAFLVHQLNRFTSKLVLQAAQMLSWEPVNAQLTPVTHADDLNRQMALLQLMMSKQISPSTGLKTLRVDYPTEVRQMLEDEQTQAEAQTQMQQEMQQATQMDQLVPSPSQMMLGTGSPGASATGQPAQGGGQPGGGQGSGSQPGAAPAAPPSAVQQFVASRVNSPNVPRSTEELNAQAYTIATQLMAMPESQKDSELIALKRSDSTVHSLVKSLMQGMRQQAQTQGGAQVLAQQFPKQGQVQPQPPTGSIRQLVNDYGKPLRAIDIESLCT